MFVGERASTISIIVTAVDNTPFHVLDPLMESSLSVGTPKITSISSTGNLSMHFEIRVVPIVAGLDQLGINQELLS